MTLPIYFSPDVWNDFKGVPGNIQRRIKLAISNRLGSAPESYGKPLRGELKSVWSLRVGDYRVIYQLRKDKVIVLQVVHRRDAYDPGVIEARERGIL